MSKSILSTEAENWNDVLSRRVTPPDETGLTRVDYAGIQESTDDLAALTEYIVYLEAQNPDDYERNEALAYWANLYNAVTVKLIVDNYPVESIREIKSGLFSIGPWGKKLITVNGKDLSLDNVEHDIMRKNYPTPLIHYMVNCASVGCPNLRNTIWHAETLEPDAKQAARDYINSPRGAVISEGGLDISTIYKWYKVDFGGSKSGILEHMREYADDDLADAIDRGLKIDVFDYDWSLNEVK